MERRGGIKVGEAQQEKEEEGQDRRYGGFILLFFRIRGDP